MRFVCDLRKDPELYSLFEKHLLERADLEKRTKWIEEQMKSMVKEYKKIHKEYWDKTEARLHALKLLDNYDEETESLEFDRESGHLFIDKDKDDKHDKMCAILANLLS